MPGVSVSPLIVGSSSVYLAKLLLHDTLPELKQLGFAVGPYTHVFKNKFKIKKTMQL